VDHYHFKKTAITPLKNHPIATNNHVHPKKLLLSKWTAVQPTHKEKHFWVVKVIEPEIIGAPVIDIELEAAMTGRTIRLPWRALKDREHWRQGWV
jgi:tryptophan-rich hypothetical protein